MREVLELLEAVAKCDSSCSSASQRLESNYAGGIDMPELESDD